jgi:hypothetical protein
MTENVRKERAYEKYAWVLFVPGNILFSFLGLTLIFVFTQTLVVLGVFKLVSFGVITVVGLRSFRRGKMWAWYALWYPVAYYIQLIIIENLNLSPVESFKGRGVDPIVAPFLVLSLLGLLLPYRMFFPKKQSTVESASRA